MANRVLLHRYYCYANTVHLPNITRKHYYLTPRALPHVIAAITGDLLGVISVSISSLPKQFPVSQPNRANLITILM